MKKRKVFVHRTLAMLLAAVMTVTAAPQAGICSYAQEQEIADGSAADDSGTDEALNADTPSDTEQVTDGDGTGSPMETVTDDPASDEEEDAEEAADGQTPDAESGQDALDTVAETADGEAAASVSEIQIQFTGDNFQLFNANDEELTDKILPITIPEDAGDLVQIVSFQLKPADGYVIQKVKSNLTKGVLTASVNPATGQGTVKVSLRNLSGYDPDTKNSIEVTTVSEENKTWTFAYGEGTEILVEKSDDSSINVGESPDHTAQISNADSVVLWVKTETETDFPFVSINGEEVQPEPETGTGEKEGYRQFILGRSFQDTTVTIETAAAWKFSFTNSLEDEEPAVSPVTVGDYELEYDGTDYELDREYFVRQGTTVCFAVSLDVELGSIKVSANGQPLEKISANDEIYYEYTLNEDTAFAIGLEPKTIELEYDENALTDLTLAESEDYELSADKKAIVYKTTSGTAYPMLRFHTKEGVRLRNVTVYFYYDEADESWATDTYGRKDVTLGEDGYYELSGGLIDSSMEKVVINTEAYGTLTLYANGAEVYEAEYDSLYDRYQHIGDSLIYAEPGLTDTQKNVEVSLDYPYYLEVSKSRSRVGYGIMLGTEADGSGQLTPVYIDDSLGVYYYRIDPKEQSVSALYARMAPHVIPIRDDTGIIDRMEATPGPEMEYNALSTDGKALNLYQADTVHFRFLPKEQANISAYYILKETDENDEYVNNRYPVDLEAAADGWYEFTLEIDSYCVEIGIESDRVSQDPAEMKFEVRELVPADEGYTEGKELTRSDNGRIETSYQYNVRAGKKYQISQYADGVRMLPDVTTLRKGFARNEENKTVELTVPESAKPGNSYTYQIMYKSENKAVKVTMKFVVTVPISSVQKMTYKTDEVERDVDSRTSSLVFQAVAEGSRINSAYIDTTGVRLEVVYYEGISNDAMSAQLLQQGKGRMQITLDIGPDVQPGTKLGELRLYNSEEAPESANYYIPGGTYIIKAREPKVLKETQPTAKITYSDDVSFTLEVSSSTDIPQPLVGKLYYKVQVTPKGDKISESVRAATQNPVFFPREIPDYSIDEETGEVIYEEIVQKQVIYVDSEEKRGLIGEWDITEYDVTVSIVQTGDPEELTPANANVAGKVRFESLKADLSDRTKASRFETKLTLKKGTTKIYTTQQDVAAATTVFQSATNNRLVTVADITQGISEEEKLSVRFADDKIYVSASGSTRLGKHTISVVPWGLATMYQPESTLTVTVEKGIEKIELTAPGSVYKQSAKAATLQVKINYNPEDTAPKAKKVKWSIVDESGEPLTQDGSELYGLVSVNSSGKVSINKKLSTEDGASYSFRVMASANDFTGNTVTAITEPITITGEAAAYETLALVNAKGEVIATNDQTADMTTDRLQGVKLAALAAKAQIGDTVDSTQEIALQDLTNVKSSNKAVVLQTEEDKITLRAVKPANNVKLQATLADGSKKSKTLVLNVKAAEPDQLALSVGLESGSAINQSGDSYAKEMTFSGTVNTRLKLCVMQKTGTAAFDRLYAYTNHTVKASGGKLIASDVAAGEYTLIVTAATATVTLKNTAKKITETYKITNSNYSSDKAPKVSIEAKTDKTVKAGQLNAGDTRTISYKLGGSYAYQGRSVKVEMSAADEVKKADAYQAFRDACNVEDTVVSVSDGGFQLTFGDGNIPAGSYKLTLTFGTATGDSITADAKPVTLTLKAAAPKKVKGSYKATSSYKLFKKPGESVVLTGSGKQIKKAAAYSDVLLASNVKGVENKFREYFELEKGKDEQDQDVVKLKLKNTLTQEQINAIAKDDLTGYVTYTVAYGDDGYGNPTVETKTVKITVKLKDQ